MKLACLLIILFPSKIEYPNYSVYILDEFRANYIFSNPIHFLKVVLSY